MKIRLWSLAAHATSINDLSRCTTLGVLTVDLAHNLPVAAHHVSFLFDGNHSVAAAFTVSIIQEAIAAGGGCGLVRVCHAERQDLWTCRDIGARNDVVCASRAEAFLGGWVVGCVATAFLFFGLIVKSSLAAEDALVSTLVWHIPTAGVVISCIIPVVRIDVCLDYSHNAVNNEVTQSTGKYCTTNLQFSYWENKPWLTS